MINVKLGKILVSHMRFKAKNWLIMILMIVTAFVANKMIPTELLSNTLPVIILEKSVPKEFGEWSALSGEQSLVVDPTQQAVINRLYSETLTRTYVNKAGDVVMLSIAYGKNQQDGYDVHKPDICYPAQGFQVSQKKYQKLTLDEAGTTLTVSTLLAIKGERIEPLLYWTTLGTKNYVSHWQKKVIEFNYSLDNKIPDGMIVRVSSLDSNKSLALKKQSKFIHDLFKSIDGKERSRFFGTAN